jgi:hypothetical protein
MKKLRQSASILFYNIKWDTDGEKVKLPKRLRVSLDKFDDEFDFAYEGADYLSDEYGWCVESFEYEITYTRSQAEEMILDNECNTIEQMVLNNDLSYVHDIFYSGFKGYAHFTDKELIGEIYEQMGINIKISGK